MEMVFRKGHMPYILVEDNGYEGVRRIAGKVAEDIGKVLGEKPFVGNEKALADRISASGSEEENDLVLCATLGKSPLLEELVRTGALNPEGLYCDKGTKEREPKWEVFRTLFLDNTEGKLFPASTLFRRVKRILLICGSDKRGTIYGMFSLSEYFGVTPLIDWGDVEPEKKDTVTVGEDFEILSKEPSVKYRGFFINDEWPCFGNWVMQHFGGFNAEAYEHFFEFLLRMKGNYLWPAMWSSSFPLDGPGSANEEQADLYGVVMGYSHHEPCLRASEEWDKVRGEGTRYGNEWNFYTNEQGLLNYWEDALKRSGKYDNIITIGMRGERDSSMLGPDATVEENINLLKRIITAQREMIDRHVKRENKKIPMLLALYKEVEPYFYGDEKTKGLKDWEGLNGVTCMLCEDNYGYLRTLPSEEIRNHEGGFGMYYHFDYHGGPISYEWVDSTPLSRTWEQMGMAYEYGIRDVWIVNVGDVKFHELPLTYFMALAYDYDKWGYGNPASYKDYTTQLIEKNFRKAGNTLCRKIEDVFTEYIRMNALRRPEALNDKVYHPCHHLETKKMLARAERVEELSKQIREELNKEEMCGEDAYYSMIHFPAMASMNLIKMHLYAGKNHMYAAQGRVIANEYARLVRECIRKDREYNAEWKRFKDGKWSGMEMAEHVGFTRWNDDDNRYPLIVEVEPVQKPRMSVSRADEERIATRGFGPPMEIDVSDFTYPGTKSVELEIANGGNQAFHFEISAENAGFPDWLKISATDGDVESLETVTLFCDRQKLPAKKEQVRLVVTGGDAKVIVVVSGQADREEWGSLPEMTFLPEREGIVINADHFCKKTEESNGSYQVIEDYGKYGKGVKVFPSTAVYEYKEEKIKKEDIQRKLREYPQVIYRFWIEEKGDYEVEFHTAPSNPAMFRHSVSILTACGDSLKKTELLPADYRGGEGNDLRWAKGALDQEHIAVQDFTLDRGVQELAVGALDAGVVLERIVIRRKGAAVKASYLGAAESEYIKTGIEMNATWR